MSNTIDSRVVEMKFDNAAFEKGVKQSAESLKNLDRTIDKTVSNSSRYKSIFSSAGSVIGKIADLIPTNALTQTASAIGNTISSIFTGTVDAIQTAGKVGLATLTALGASVTALAASGGMKRALNIEQAQFQLQGLLKEAYNWDEILEDLNYGVKDTAYGLDSAARAAAQLAASKISFGQDMQTALRAISGVAAMTNREYDEVAHIFTTVAGNNRLMGMQLTQLSSYGLNAAATLGEYLDKTEEEVRDMVSKGEIDFATFAAAMDDAFGQHAKDANKTFTGAMSNVKAALSRFGEKFATPYIKNMHDIFVALIPFINLINNALGPAVEKATEVMGKMSSTISKILGELTNTEQKFDQYGVEALTDAQRTLRSFTHIFENLVYISDKFTTAFTEAFHGLYLEIFGLEPSARTVVDYIERAVVALNDFLKVSDLTAIIRLAANPIAQVAAGLKGLMDIFQREVQASGADIWNYIVHFSENMSAILTEAALTWNAALFQIEIFLPYIKTAIGVLSDMSDALMDVVFPDNETDVGFFKFVSSIIAKIKELLPTAEQLQRAANIITSAFRTITSAVRTIVTTLAGAESIFDVIRDGLQTLYETILTGGEAASSRFKTFVESLVSKLPSLSDVSAGIQAAADAIFNFLNSLHRRLADAGILDEIKNFFSNLRLYDVLSVFNTSGLLMAVTMISNALDGIKGGLQYAKDFKFPTIANLLGLGPALRSLTDTFIEVQGALKANVIRNIALAMLAFAAAMMVMSSIPADKMVQVALSLLLFVAVMTRMLDEVAPLMKSTRVSSIMAGNINILSNNSMLGFVIGLGASMLLMASAMKKLSTINSEDMLRGVAGMAVIFLALHTLLDLMGTMSKDGALALKGGLTFVGIGVAFAFMAATIKTLSSIKFDEKSLLSTIAGMVLITASIAALLIVLSGFNAKDAVSLAAASLLFSTIGPMFLSLAATMKILASIDSSSIDQAINVMAGLSIIITLLVVAIGSISSANLSAGIGVFLSMSVLFLAITSSLKILSTVDTGGMLVAVGGLLATFAILGTAIGYLSSLDADDAAKGVVGIVAISGAVAILAPALRILSTISVGGLIKATAALAGVLVLITLFSKVAESSIAGMTTLSAALTSVGVAMLSFGAGAALFGLACVLVVTALAELIAILAQIGTYGQEAFNELGNALRLALISMAGAIVGAIGPIAEAAGAMILAFIDGVRQTFGELIQLGVDLVTGFLGGIADNIGSVVSTGIDIIVNFIAGVASQIGSVIDSAVWTGIMFIKGLADGFKNNLGYVITSVGILINTIGSVLLGGLADILASNPLTSGLAEGVRGASDDLAAAAEEASAALQEKFDEKYGNVEQGAVEMRDGVVNTMSDSAAYEPAGESLISGIASGMMSNSSLIPEQFQGVMDEVGVQMAASAESSSEYGTDAGQAYGDALGETGPYISEQFVGAAENASDEAGSIDSRSDGNTVGNNFGSGVFYGIDSWRSSVASKARQMVSEAKAAANSEMDAASPAKDLIKSGGWFGEGFMIGIANMIKPVSDTAADMVSGAKESVEGLLTTTGGILDLLDLDANPVITPVLDTSMLQSGVRSIDGMFGGSSLGVGFGLTASAMPRVPIQSMNSNRGIQNNSTNIYIDGDLLRSDDDIRGLYEQWTMEVRRRVMA